MTTEAKRSPEVISSHHQDFLHQVEQVYCGDILAKVFKKYTILSTWNFSDEERGHALDGQATLGNFYLRIRERERIEDDGRAKYYSLSFPGGWVSAGPLLSSENQVIGEGLTLHTAWSKGFYLNSPNSKKIMPIILEICQQAPPRVLTRSPG